MKTAIIIVNYKTPWHLNLCLNSVFRNTDLADFHIFLVHNSQDVKSYAVGDKYLNKYPLNLTVIKNNENLGLTKGVAAAYEYVKEYDYICLLNSDTIVSKDWLKSLMYEMQENLQVAMIIPDSNSYYPESLLWRIVKTLPFNLSRLQILQLFRPAKNKRNIDFETNTFFIDFGGGFCTLFRSKPVIERGYILDCNIAHGYWDDLELTLYLRNFGEIRTSYKSYVYHFTNVTFKLLEKKDFYLKRSMKNYNGYYVFKKYKDKLLKGLRAYPIDQLESLAQNPYINKFLEYLALSSAIEGFDDFIDTLPAQAIWEKLKN